MVGVAAGAELPPAFCDADAVLVAQRLIGIWLQVGSAGGVIVETEAYRPDDRASHSYNGETPRNRAMFGPPAHAYVYRSYGVHWCFNIVCERAGAVLIRALMPVTGIDLMRQRRGIDDMRKLCSGPGRLCQALGIDLSLDGRPIDRPPLLLAEGLAEVEVLVGPRIGITRDVERSWRFGLKGSPFLSRAFRPPISGSRGAGASRAE